MNIFSGGLSDFFGLDIGATSLQAVQLKGTGPIKTLVHYGRAETEGNITVSDSKEDWNKLAAAIADLVKKSGISTSNVAVGLPSQRVFTTVIDMDKQSSDDLAQAIRTQADSLIPTPLSESKLDWAVLGDTTRGDNKVEVLLTSVPNVYIESRLDLLESIGLNVIAFEPTSLALMRSLIAPDDPAAQLILDIGMVSTDLVIAMNGAPRLARAIPIGYKALVDAAMTHLNIPESQAQQLIFKFGVAKDKLDGQVYNAIIGTVENLMAEIDKSIKFFYGRYPNTKLTKILVTGGASTLPEIPLYIANKFAMNVEIGSAWRNVSFNPIMQNDLLAVSNHFAAAAGLAERTN